MTVAKNPAKMSHQNSVSRQSLLIKRRRRKSLNLWHIQYLLAPTLSAVVLLVLSRPFRLSLSLPIHFYRASLLCLSLSACFSLCLSISIDSSPFSPSLSLSLSLCFSLPPWKRWMMRLLSMCPSTTPLLLSKCRIGMPCRRCRTVAQFLRALIGMMSPISGTFPQKGA